VDIVILMNYTRRLTMHQRCTDFWRWYWWLFTSVFSFSFALLCLWPCSTT